MPNVSRLPAKLTTTSVSPGNQPATHTHTHTHSPTSALIQTPGPCVLPAPLTPLPPFPSSHQRQQLAEQLLRTARKCRPKTSSDSNGSCLEQLLPEPHRLRSSPTPPLAFGGVAYVWRCKDKRRHLLTLAAVAVEHRKYPPQMGFQLAATVSHQPAIVLSSVAAHPATWTGHCRGAQIKMKSKWGPIITTSFAG